MREKLKDTWGERDYLVLREVGRRFEEEPGTILSSRELAAALGLEEDDIIRAVIALAPGFIVIQRQNLMGGSMPLVSVRGVTERGRREVGLWPSEGGVEALVYELFQAAERADTLEERSKLRKAAEAIGGVGRDVMGGVLGAVVTRSIGMQRREIVAEMTEAGMITRAIASGLGIAQRTVMRD